MHGFAARPACCGSKGPISRFGLVVLGWATVRGRPIRLLSAGFWLALGCGGLVGVGSLRSLKRLTGPFQAFLRDWGDFGKRRTQATVKEAVACGLGDKEV